MASRRGLNNQERLAVNAVTLTADGWVVNAPLYIYSVLVCRTGEGTASARVDIADTSASADTSKDTIIRAYLPANANATGGDGSGLFMSYNPPIYVAKGAGIDVTGTPAVSVTYLEAS